MVFSARGGMVSERAPELSIVVPAHNEERRIAATLETYCREFSQSTEIIVVVNGCTDGTLDVVEQAVRTFPSVLKIVNIPEAVGKGGAVRQGFRGAKGVLIGFVDADAATSPQEFRRLVDSIGDDDGVIASRRKRGARVYNRSLWRTFVSTGFAAVTRRLFRLPYDDTQCGAKVFRHQVVTALLPKLQLHDMVFDVELLVLARAAGFRIREEPTVWYDRSSSAFLGRPSQVLRMSVMMFGSLVRLYQRARREHYLETR